VINCAHIGVNNNNNNNNLICIAPACRMTSEALYVPIEIRGVSKPTDTVLGKYPFRTKFPENLQPWYQHDRINCE